MSETKTARVWRRANVSEDVAMAGIDLRYPSTEGWVIKSFATEKREDASGVFDAFVAELEKTAAPFPPQDDEAEQADDSLPEPEPDDEHKPEHKKDGDSEVLSLLHKILKHLGLGEDVESDDPGADLSKPGDGLPPPAKPLPTMNPAGAPHNMPAFGSLITTEDFSKIAKTRISFVEVVDDGRKISAYTKPMNEMLSVIGKEITQVNRGTVKGVKLIRAKVEPKKS
jgi:hypothetical protein